MKRKRDDTKWQNYLTFRSLIYTEKIIAERLKKQTAVFRLRSGIPTHRLSILMVETQKVNINLLYENDVEVYEVGEGLFIVIYVPVAKREQKPVFINNDIFGGTFRRDHSGDYHCTRL